MDKPLFSRLRTPAAAAGTRAARGQVNPQPCGHWNDPTRECRCTPLQIQRYVGRISGPLLDRIDIHVDVPAVRFKELRGEAPAGESSSEIRARVVAARARQRARLRAEGVFS